jgi:hypothetical protein
MLSETHMPQGDMLIRDILPRARGEGPAPWPRGQQPAGAADRVEGWRTRLGRPLTGTSVVEMSVSQSGLICARCATASATIAKYSTNIRRSDTSFASASAARWRE